MLQRVLPVARIAGVVGIGSGTADLDRRQERYLLNRLQLGILRGQEELDAGGIREPAGSITQVVVYLEANPRAGL